jgi:hypothetical protein
MSSVVIAGNTSGTITLDAPNVAGTTVLTLPTANGTVLTSANINSNLPAGSVLQVVQGLASAQVLSTSSTFADTGLTATITPSSASNKILVLVTADGVYASGTTNVIATFQIVKNGSALYVFGSAGNSATPTLTIVTGSCSVNYLDSPATTSALTYKLQIVNKYGVGTVGVSTYDGKQSITLMEIKG